MDCDLYLEEIECALRISVHSATGVIIVRSSNHWIKKQREARAYLRQNERKSH